MSFTEGDVSITSRVLKNLELVFLYFGVDDWDIKYIWIFEKLKKFIQKGNKVADQIED